MWNHFHPPVRLDSRHRRPHLHHNLVAVIFAFCLSAFWSAWRAWRPERNPARQENPQNWPWSAAWPFPGIPAPTLPWERQSSELSQKRTFRGRPERTEPVCSIPWRWNRSLHDHHHYHSCTRRGQWMRWRCLARTSWTPPPWCTRTC